jgi:hypothetical protein
MDLPAQPYFYFAFCAIFCDLIAPIGLRRFPARESPGKNPSMHYQAKGLFCLSRHPVSRNQPGVSARANPSSNQACVDARVLGLGGAQYWLELVKLVLPYTHATIDEERRADVEARRREREFE